MTKKSKTKEGKDRDLTQIIEEAFEAGFLSMLGPYVFRAPDDVEFDEEGGAAEESPAMLPQTREISLS